MKKNVLFVFALLCLTASPAYGKETNENIIETVSVFGDSMLEKTDKNGKAAYQLGKILAQQKKKLVFGGETSGLSGEMLKGAYDAHADITLITVPESFNAFCPENHFCRQLTYTFVESEEERRMTRADLGDVIVILPGGWESLALFAELANLQAQNRIYFNEDKELLKREILMGKKSPAELETADLTQPKIKPIIFLNINHYWDNLRYLIDEMRRQNILSKAETLFIGFAGKPKDVLPLAQKMMNQN